MRLFVALEPPVQVLAHLQEAALDLGRGVRACPPEQTHLTLAFLGEVPDPAPVIGALDKVLPGLSAPTLRLDGGGSFRGGALWLRPVGDLPVLKALARQVQDAVRSAGVALEERPWRAHVTVGRARTSVLPPDLNGYAGPEALWEQVSLVRSHLGRDGARHEVLRDWRLADRSS